MDGLLSRVSTCFSAGVFGGLIGSLGAWLAGHYGWTTAMGVAVVPQWDGAWLYPRLVTGGLWGLLFVPPFLAGSLFWRGLFLGVFPTLAQLLIVFPAEPQVGLWGLGLGTWTAAYVLAVEALWGWSAAAWVLGASDEGRGGYHRLR